MNRKQAIKFIEFQLDIYKRLGYKAKISTLIGTLELSLAALKEQEERENPRPLTIEELMERDDPVWTTYKALGSPDGFWCICQKGFITCPSGQSYDVREIPHWMFYRGRVELCSK